MSTPSVYQPTTLGELVTLLEAHPFAQLLGGGTLVVPTWQDRGTPSSVIYLPTVTALHRLEESCCGAAVTLTQLASEGRFPLALREAAASIAGPAVRNLATIGGNLAGQGPKCLAVALLALQATVERIENIPSSRTSQCDLSAALANPGAPITTVRWNVPAGAQSTFLKLGLRATGGPNLGAVAVNWGGSSHSGACTIAVGSTGAVPHRLPEAEEQWHKLAHDPVTAAAAAGCVAGATALVVGDSVADEPYRRHLIEVLVQRALLKLTRKERERKAEL